MKEMIVFIAALIILRTTIWIVGSRIVDVIIEVQEQIIEQKE